MEARTILLVDSDPDSLTIYSMILEHNGYRVLRTHSAEHALRLAAEAELIVADLSVRVDDGRSLAGSLKSDCRTASRPVVATGASLLFIDGDGCRPPDRFLVKPCTPTRMLEEIRQLLPPVGAAGG